MAMMTFWLQFVLSWLCGLLLVMILKHGSCSHEEIPIETSSSNSFLFELKSVSHRSTYHTLALLLQPSLAERELECITRATERSLTFASFLCMLFVHTATSQSFETLHSDNFSLAFIRQRSRRLSLLIHSSPVSHYGRVTPSTSASATQRCSIRTMCLACTCRWRYCFYARPYAA